MESYTDVMPVNMEIDFGRRSDDYATHRPGFPASFFDRLESFIPLVGIRAADLGTGPGVVALDLAERGAVVSGVDVAENQILAAREQAERRRLAEHADFRIAPAEETGLPGAEFDLVTAGQCWVWFDHDRALAEAKRLLKPGGWLIVAHYCYLPQQSEVAAASEALILKLNPTWPMAGWDGLYPKQIDALTRDDFQMIEQFSYIHMQPFTHEAWRGRIRCCNGVGSGILTDDQVEQFDQEHASMLAERFPEEPMLIHHRVWATIVRKPELDSS